MQKKEERYYQGIDGYNWYLNLESFQEIDDFFNENLMKSWEDSDYVDVCNDIGYIRKYIELSEEFDIEYRILACVTEKKLPQMVYAEDTNMIFLGYDYAYDGGSYYSAVQNDVVAKRIPEFMNIQLNRYGLFNTREEVEDFVKLRKALEKKERSGVEYLEKGDYIIYELYEVKI